MCFKARQLNDRLAWPMPGDDGNALVDVSALSDDDGCADRMPAAFDAFEPVPLPSKFSRHAKRKSLQENRDFNEARNSLKIVVSSNCKCKSVECRAPFRDQTEFDRLLSVRMKLHAQPKTDADKEAGSNIIFISHGSL